MRNKFLRGTSVLAVAGALSSLIVPVMAHAQAPAPAGDDEAVEVIVTGIRGSLSAAARIKRQSVVGLDSITSEDLGKFPDGNVAESLQRIPGVSIDRSLGEGSSVTVRGFGPQFNNVLLNGRTIANDSGGRGFGFDNIAAELISGADVYKTSRASIPEGGIGSTINLKTPRPLDIGATKGVVSLKAHNESLSGKTTPSAFALYSTTFDDGKMGLMVSASYQLRDAREDSFNVSGYVPNASIGTQAGQTNGYGSNLSPNVPLFTNVRFPRNYNLNLSEQRQERTGLTATYQYRPSSELTFTADALFSRYNIKRTVATGAFYFLENQVRTAAIDANRDVIEQTENGQWDMVMQAYPRKSDTTAFGINMDWHPNDQLTIVGDLSTSDASNVGGSGSYYIVVGIPTNVTWKQPSDGSLPQLEVLGASISDPSNARAHYATRGGGNTSTSVQEGRLDATYVVDRGVFSSVMLGVAFNDTRKENESFGIGDAYCTYCGYPVVLPQRFLTPLDLGGDFLGGGLGANAPLKFFSFDGLELLNYLGSPEALAQLDTYYGRAPGSVAAQLEANGGYTLKRQPSSYWVEEKTSSAYIETNFAGEVADMPWSLNLGARYISTKVRASGSDRQLVDVKWISEGNQTPVYASATPVERTVEANYSKLLPSLNVKLNITRHLLARFGASETLTRPSPSDMRPNTSIDDARQGNMRASGGNPALKPYLSKNLDLSLEWYPKKNLNLAAAIFSKDVSDFIDYGVASEAFTITNAQRLDTTSVIDGRTHLADPAFTATTATFLTRRPRNLAKTRAEGIELAGTYSFDFLPGWWSGFGVTANATLVDSNAKVSNSTEVAGRTFALPGLGNSYNLIGFYEKGPLSVRVAYNKRDRFLSSLSGDGSGGPVFTQAYDQIDMRASYQITPRVDVFIEGTNLTKEHLVQKGYYEAELLGDNLDGAFYNVGFRMTF
ncbi:TonB-dependent receptor [Asticcacaulis benevestitus]|uniref:TonB-dependent receptor n=1 Tax=Asticcacaulis benevestitus TaxID=347481 RepID=UPI000AE02BFD|nr:TonB-dependent receptor [Asticcacaulis benevestitus]